MSKYKGKKSHTHNMQVQKEKESDKALIKQSKNRKLCSEGSALRKQAQKIEKKYKRRIKF